MNAHTSLDFRIVGRRFEARGLTPALAGWLRRRWRRPRQRALRHHYGIRVELVESAPPPLSGEARIATLRDDAAMEWRSQGDEWEMGDAAAGLRLSFHPRGARILVWEVDGWSGRGRLPEALYLAICEALRRSGLVPLHAAVIVRDGRATALAGASGAGKSSTLLRALTAGWQPLSEDLAWLDPSTMAIHGWDRGVRLWPEGRSLLEAELPVNNGGWRPDGHGKEFLPFDRLAAPVVRVAKLSRIVVIRRDAAAETEWEPLSMREAVRAVWEAAGVPLTPTARAALARLLPHLLEQVEVHAIHLPLREAVAYSMDAAVAG